MLSTLGEILTILSISGVSFAFNPTAGLGSNHEPSFLNINSEILTLFFTFLLRYGPPRSYIPFYRISKVCLSRAGGLICQNLFLVIVQGAITPEVKLLVTPPERIKLSRIIPANFIHPGFDSVLKNFQIKSGILKFVCLPVEFSEGFSSM